MEKRKYKKNSWEHVLWDALETLKQAKARVRAIKRSIRGIQAKIEAGEKCPLGQSK